MHSFRSLRALVAASFCAASLLVSIVPALAQSGQTTTTTTAPAAPPVRQGNFNGRSIVSQLRAASTTRNIPVRRKLSAKQRAVEASRIAKMTPAQRKKLVLKKYDIAPVGWLSSYLPADRYKFGKVWQYVSTETDKRYYRPQDMARKRFNANRVIGFRTWQEAMQAGYTPDPASRPAPGAQILALSQYTSGPNFYRFVEYTYAGQVSPYQFEASYNYARQVGNSLRNSKEGRKYLRNTIDRVFRAIVEGNPDLIPATVGGPPPAPKTDAGGSGGTSGGMGASGAPSAAPTFPGNVSAGGAPSGSMSSGSMSGGAPGR